MAMDFPQVMTPFLTSKLAGHYVAVDPAGLFLSTVQVAIHPHSLSSPPPQPFSFSLIIIVVVIIMVPPAQVVLAPVLVGALLNQYCGSLVGFISPVMPFIAVATVAVLCGSAIAQNAAFILASGLQVVVAVGSLHAAGFFFGYVLSRLLGLEERSARTISIEVGMQNSVLGVVLAGRHLGSPLAAVPCAVSSVCHSVYGSALAGVWRSSPPAAPAE